MKLNDYISEAKITQKAFAKELDVHELTVSRWIHGERFPSRRSQAKISELTGGAVTPRDWIEAQT